MRRVSTVAGTVWLLLLWSTAASAISCPTPEIIRDRKVHPAYEWTVDEGVTLTAVLSAARLTGAELQGSGEFVMCTYERDDGQVLHLYALPKGNHCVLKGKAGDWAPADGNRLVCDDKDLYRCIFVFTCEKTQTP